MPCLLLGQGVGGCLDNEREQDDGEAVGVGHVQGFQPVLKVLEDGLKGIRQRLQPAPYEGEGLGISMRGRRSG